MLSSDPFSGLVSCVLRSGLSPTVDLAEIVSSVAGTLPNLDNRTEEVSNTTESGSVGAIRGDSSIARFATNLLSDHQFYTISDLRSSRRARFYSISDLRNLVIQTMKENPDSNIEERVQSIMSHMIAETYMEGGQSPAGLLENSNNILDEEVLQAPLIMRRTLNMLAIDTEIDAIASAFFASTPSLSLGERVLQTAVAISIQSPRLSEDRSRALQLICLFNHQTCFRQDSLLVDELLRDEPPSEAAILELLHHALRISRNNEEILRLFFILFSVRDLLQRDFYRLISLFVDSGLSLDSESSSSFSGGHKVFLPCFESLSTHQLKSLLQSAQKHGNSPEFIETLKGILSLRRDLKAIDEASVPVSLSPLPINTLSRSFVSDASNNWIADVSIPPPTVTVEESFISSIIARFVKHTPRLTEAARIKSLISAVITKSGFDPNEQIELQLLASLCDQSLIAFRLLASKPFSVEVSLDRVLNRAIENNQVERVFPILMLYNQQAVLRHLYTTLASILGSSANFDAIHFRYATANSINLYQYQTSAAYLLFHSFSLSLREIEELIILANQMGREKQAKLLQDLLMLWVKVNTLSPKDGSF